MATEKTESKSQILNRLFKENGLIAEDYYQHKHYTIITRSGIEKIQYQNNITVGFEAITMQPEFCVVKATATKPVKGKEAVRVETFGSAGHGAKGEADQGKVKTNQYAYYPELAEKRALSRAVLKITNFYELGVFGEDEADDFKKPTNTQQPDPAKRAAAVKAMAVTTATDAPPATGEQIAKIKALLNDDLITPAEEESTLARIEAGLTQEAADKAILYFESKIVSRKTKAA